MFVIVKLALAFSLEAKTFTVIKSEVYSGEVFTSCVKIFLFFMPKHLFITARHG